MSRNELKQSASKQRKADWSESDMQHLTQMVVRWIHAEAEARSDAEVHARGVLQALPRPHPGRDLVAAVMSALAPPSLWSRRPVRYLVLAAVVFLGIGIAGVAGSAPALAAIARLSVWRELASQLLFTALDFVLGIGAAVATTVEVVAGSPQLTTLRTTAPWAGVLLFMAGILALTWMSLWREKETWNHA